MTLVKSAPDPISSSPISSLIGAPDTQGNLPPADVAMQTAQPNPLVVDDRMIPDAGLPTEQVSGVLDIANEGSGLLRPVRFAPSDHDIYISSSQIRRFNLRVGDMVQAKPGVQKKMNVIGDFLKLKT